MASFDYDVAIIELATEAFRTVGPGDAIPNDFVVPSRGLLTGTTLMCQGHGSRFDIATGP